jgi:uncharacterized Zn-finger protein
MIDHRRSVHRDRKYQCDECGSTFKNSSTLKSHVVSIHLSHENKPLKCSICGKGFLHESRRKAHMLIHSDDAPFACQFCARPNKCKNNNIKHEKRCKKADVGNVEAATATLKMVSATPPPTTQIILQEVPMAVVEEEDEVPIAIEFVNVSVTEKVELT